MVTLRKLTYAECQQVREWRNDPSVFPMLRTGYKTVEQQAEFYRTVIDEPSSPHRYYAVDANGVFVGMGGLTYLDKVPGVGEISLLLAPEARLSGLGTAAVRALLLKAFNGLELRSVVGECYQRSPALGFWQKLLQRMVDNGVAGAVEFVNRNDALFWNWRRPDDVRAH
jgi:RimJ/RimL family protein N-acetyltransferase